MEQMQSIKTELNMNPSTDSAGSPPPPRFSTLSGATKYAGASIRLASGLLLITSDSKGISAHNATIIFTVTN